MPRIHVRKTSIGLHTSEQMKDALMQISQGNKIRNVARLTGIPYTTLYRYNTKVKNAPTQQQRLTPNYAVNKIFTTEQELTLVDYLIKCSQMFYGLTPLDVRKLAYELACINNIKMPQNWLRTEAAGVDWLYGFRKRHTVLSLRTPEGCSLSRATAFNRHNVNIFFDNLKEAMSRNSNFGNGTRVYNLDETNTVTVQKSGKVLAPKGQKQVSKVTSAEKGTLVTTCYIINATGYALPPVMIFPRVHFKTHMIAGAPAGTLGLANQSGWMNTELFISTMQHFISVTQSSKDNPSLLIMDNYEAHISLQALNLAKDNGVTILTVPPHSTGKLQPLDVALFKPFKTAYNTAVDNWMMRNAGKTFTIYEVAQCVKEAHMKSMTPSNICSAFEASGIFPYNRDIFTDIDFAPSEITDRPLVNDNSVLEEICPFRTSITSEDANIPARVINNPIYDLTCPSESSLTSRDSNNLASVLQNLEVHNTTAAPEQNRQTSDLLAENNLTPISHELLQTTPRKDSEQSSTATPMTSLEIPGTSAQFISPFEMRGLPKAGPRQNGRKPRRKGKSMIATDTPNKDEIEARQSAKKVKTIKTTKRKVLQSDSSDEELERMSIYSEDEGSFGEEADCYNDCIDPGNFRPLGKIPPEGKYVLVIFQLNKSKKVYYVGKVLREINREAEVSFLRKCAKQTNTFRMPNVPDLAIVPLCDIKMILSQPSFSGQTKRQQGFYIFNYDFSHIDIR